MAWEGPTIKLLSAALLRLVDRIGSGFQERQAAKLVSEATQELLKELPNTEKARALILEAEAKLEIPSAELLKAQVILDRVLGLKESAKQAIQGLHRFYESEGSMASIAETHYLAGSAYLDFGEMDIALEYFDKALRIFVEIDDRRGIIPTLVHVLEVTAVESREQEFRDSVRSFLAAGATSVAGSFTSVGDILSERHNMFQTAARFYAVSAVLDDCLDNYQQLEVVRKGEHCSTKERFEELRVEVSTLLEA